MFTIFLKKTRKTTLFLERQLINSVFFAEQQKVKFTHEMLQENAFTLCQRTKTARFYLTKMVDYEVISQINF